MGYVSLHNHSFFSLLDSTLPPARIVEAAAACGMDSVALTDRDTLAGAVAFYKTARAQGIHPVIGAELTLSGGSRLLLLVEDARGYRNLCLLISARRQHPEGPPLALLAEHSQGLIALAGPQSEIAHAVRADRPVETSARALYDIFGRNLALEISPHHEDDLRLARVFAALGRRAQIPLVAAVDTHYLDERERLRYDILAGMRTLTLLGQKHPEKLPSGRYHWHTPEEMRDFFGSLPQALENTCRVAERCRFDFELGEIRFPNFPCDDPCALLRAKTERGLERRYGLTPAPEVRERLQREMSVIEDVGYAEYFLIFAEIVEWSNAHGISTLARGSAAGSLVCYLLGISNVCPFRFGLTFERFLNRERMSFSKLADIDLDLPWDRRDEVINHVFDTYGRDHVAMIGAIHTFQGRSAVADIAKVYGVPEREVRRFTENLPWYRGNAESAVRDIPECRDLPANQEPYKTVLSLAGAFDGFPRHFAMHPCGLVVSGDPIAARMPIFQSGKDLPTTHYTMDDVEELGLIKLDLLGQAGLAVLRDTLGNLRDNRRPDVDLERLDWTDSPTWDAISSGHARGVFHIESPAMTSLLVMSNCRDIDCLTVVESIIRPGAANEGRKRAFARRYQGLEAVDYPHPSLENLLKDSYGLLAFEEHILLVANGFAGMNWGRADLLRRALVKNKDRALIESLGRELCDCARALGRSPEEIDSVWGTLSEFAGYMFNKAHSAAYAVEAFAGAWLKTRYPVEFLAAVLTSRRGFYAPILYVLEALRNGARFLLPDLHLSEPARFLVSGDTIRLPLDQVKGISQTTLDRIAAGRPFESPGDFFRRAQPARDEWIALLKAGVLDVFCEPRGRLFWRLQRLEAAGRADASHTLVDPVLPDAFDASRLARARWEHEILGFPVSVSPLDYFAPKVDWSRFYSVGELTRRQAELYHQQVRVCGLVVADRRHPTPQGTMKFLTLADHTGFVEVNLFSRTYQEYGHLTVRPVVAVQATVDPFDNHRGFSLTAGSVFVP